MIMDTHTETSQSVRTICRVLDLPRSSFYHSARPSVRGRSDQEKRHVIETIFKRHRRRYGHRRIWREMADHNVVCAPHRVRRLMRERGLRAIPPRHFIPMTSDGKASQPSCRSRSANQVWTGDITFIPAQSGWLYLAIVMDLCSRKILGWSLAEHMRADLALDTLNQAIACRDHSSELIFDSDRGT